MTTGTTGTAGAPASGFSGFRSYSTWTGDDGKYEIYQGFKRPKWNSYSATKSRLQSFNGMVGYHCPLGHVIEHGVSFSYCNNSTTGSSLPAFSNSDRNAMLSRLLGKVRGHSFNAAVNLAQTRELADMVVSNLGKLGRSFMALRHGDFATAARQLGASPRPTRLKPSDVSGRWLELQYGWLPTISDTYEAAKAFEAISNGPSKTRFTVRSEKKGVQTVSGGIAAISQQLAQRRVLSYTLELQEEMSFSRQLGLLDPLSVAWEIIPYSFVVDWFVPIGTYLEDLNQIPTLKGRWLVTESKITKGVRVYQSGTLPFCDIHSGAGKRYDYISHYADVQYSSEEVTRSALGSPPKISLPEIKLGGAVHGRRVWNAISLAYQRFV